MARPRCSTRVTELTTPARGTQSPAVHVPVTAMPRTRTEKSGAAASTNRPRTVPVSPTRTITSGSTRVLRTLTTRIPTR
ncbi:MAG: hypothetical protein M5U14_09155 [Acidimicrobiia bacterium]|nr:hypothetical protein [Acidimicrobiia bacterium]